MTKEDILKLADNQGLFDYFDLEGDSVGQLMLYTLVLDCMAAEREACAKECEDEIKRVKPIYSVVAENVLKAIRARGQK